MDRIFLINRTEHPRLAERVRCLCVGCDVTWGPPCQALVTRLPANRRQWAENNRPTQNSSNNTQYTIDFPWFGVRPTSTGDQRRVYLLEKRNTHSRSLFSLGKKRKSNLSCGRKLAAGDLTRVSENRTSSRG